MLFIILLAALLNLDSVSQVALRYAGCQVIERPSPDPGVVVVKWVCPNR